MEVEKRDRIAIIGKNGYGKSTILKLLAQELIPDQGIFIAAPSLRIGYFGQTSIERLNPHLRIEEEIANANKELSFGNVRAICGAMMFSGDLAKKTISVLSGGEKSRVLLGKILAKPCNLLLLDEPTHHLDIESIEALIDAIEEFEGAVILVTHSEWVLRRIPFTKLVICHKEKQELFLGNYDEFLSRSGWIEEEKTEKKKPKPLPLPVKSSKDEIKKCEDRIMLLEASIATLNEQLATLSTSFRNNNIQIRDLLSQIATQQQEIHALYERLGILYR